MTFASDMSRVPDASMLTGEVSSSLISGNPVLGFLLRAAGRIRTDDLPLTRRLLYQLSYGSITGVNPLRLGIPLEPWDVASSRTSGTGSFLRVFLLPVDNHLAGHLLIVTTHDVAGNTKH